MLVGNTHIHVCTHAHIHKGDRKPFVSGGIKTAHTWMDTGKEMRKTMTIDMVQREKKVRTFKKDMTIRCLCVFGHELKADFLF